MVKERSSNNTLDVEFSLVELKSAIGGANQTSPGKDEVYYNMIKNLSDTSLNIILHLYYKSMEDRETPNITEAWCNCTN